MQLKNVLPIILHQKYLIVFNSKLESKLKKKKLDFFNHVNIGDIRKKIFV